MKKTLEGEREEGRERRRERERDVVDQRNFFNTKIYHTKIRHTKISQSTLYFYMYLNEYRHKPIPGSGTGLQ